MNVKNVLKIFFSVLFIFLIIYFLNLKFFKSKEVVTKEIVTNEEIVTDEEIIYKSNIIENVNYITKDKDGNEYIINAVQGEIDYSSPNIIYLTKINAVVSLKDGSLIKISSDYGRYNSDNFDTIFTKNVIIKYLENKIKGEYVDFSLERNSMTISKKVIYSNLDNILNADVIEINIKTKDTKIFMYEDKKKVNIKSK